MTTVSNTGSAISIETVPSDILRAWADAGVISVALYVEIMARRKKTKQNV